MTEENYFFRLSAYADRLLEHYEAHPEARRSRRSAATRSSRSIRAASRTSRSAGPPSTGGSACPGTPRHVCYVWFDALTNYVTAAGYGSTTPSGSPGSGRPTSTLIGKDILRFHAVYWPAMLMAAGVELPAQVWAHGFLTVGGEKMSKTNATGIHPFELLDHFGVDSYRYYFMREIQFGADGNFSWESMVERHNADLANGLGNLASRVLAMLGSYYGGQVPAAGSGRGRAGRSPRWCPTSPPRMDAHMRRGGALTAAVGAVWELVDAANKYLVETEPWALGEGRRPSGRARGGPVHGRGDAPDPRRARSRP